MQAWELCKASPRICPLGSGLALEDERALRHRTDFWTKGSLCIANPLAVWKTRVCCCSDDLFGVAGVWAVQRGWSTKWVWIDRVGSMSEYLECQPKAVVFMPRPGEALDSCFWFSCLECAFSSFPATNFVFSLTWHLSFLLVCNNCSQLRMLLPLQGHLE